MTHMWQHGAWWKGITENGVEVAVSDAFFKSIFFKQQESALLHPALVANTRRHYGDIETPTCHYPQWWVDCFLDTEYAIGPGPHTWVHKRGYHKLMLGEVGNRGYSNVEVGSEGTLIFRQLTPKRLAQLLQYEADMVSMLEEAKDFFTSRGVTLEIRGEP